MESRVKDRLRFLIRELGDEDEDTTPVNNAASSMADDVDGQSVASESFTDLSDITMSDSMDMLEDVAGSRGRSQHRASVSASHVHTLEDRVLRLTREKARMQAQYEQDMRSKNTEIIKLCEDLKRIEHRQEQVEAKAPLLAQQAQQAKLALNELKISEDNYLELKNTPLEKLSLPDHVKLVVHESVRELKADNERMKVALEGSREAGARLEGDKARLQRENARLAAEVVERGRDMDNTISGLQTRIERLAKELEVALTQVEVLTAKGQMYDELQERTERLEDDNRRLLTSEAGGKRVERHAAELEGLLREREHTLQLLMMDKAYLSKQVEAVQEQAQRLERECERRSAKVSELKKSRQELWDKLVAEAGASKDSHAAALQQEVGRIQAAAQADLERIRRESMDAYEREARLLRDLRDEAQGEAARMQVALRTLQKEHTALAEKHATVSRELEGRVGELQVKLQAAEFMGSRSKQLAEEREIGLNKALKQVDALQEKVRVLTDSFYELEADRSRSVSELRAQVEQQGAALQQYRVLEGNLDAAITAAAGDTEAGGAGGTGDEQLSKMLDAAGLAAVRIRLRHSVALAARCSRLEAERSALASELEAASQKLSKLEAELAVAQHRARAVGQPHAFLLDELQAAQEKAMLAAEKLKAAEAVLQQREHELQSTSLQVVALKEDLHRLLTQRGSLDALKAMVAAALQPAAVAVSSVRADGAGLHSVATKSLGTALSVTT